MNKKKLTILHSNDLHGDFLSEKLDEKLLGGVSLLSGYINKARNEEQNLIYAIAGDMFRGSVIDAEYKGISTIEIMNILGPDVVTLGNHEVDYGLSHLLFIEKCAKFPIINANLYIKSNHQHLFKPHHVVEIGGMRILFIGILTQEVLAQTKQDALIGTLVDVNEAVAEVGRITNAYKSIDIDLTVLLTHIGYEEDKKLASMLDPAWGIDIIIGGHSHTLLEKPEVVNNVLIVQAGTGTDQIGRFNLEIDTDTNSVASYEWELVPIDDTHCPRDIDLEQTIKKYKDQTDMKYGRIVTRFTRELTHPSRTQETELGNLFSDILRDSLGIDIMMLGSGSIRLEKLGPLVNYGNLSETFPYDDAVFMIKVTGKQLRKMVLHILRDEAYEGHTEFYQYSHGIHIRYSVPKHELVEFTFEGEPVADDRVYTVGLQKFHFSNLKPFFNVELEEVEKNMKARVVSTSCRDVLEEYLSSNQHLHREIEGRLIIEK